MKEENNLTENEPSILFLQELDIIGPNQDCMNSLQSALVAPTVFALVEKFGLDSAHLLSLQPKAGFHLDIMLSAQFRIYTWVEGTCLALLPVRCWHRET